jgi:hypothetical protein
MQPSPQIASPSLPEQYSQMESSRNPANLVYQVVTIAAMLMLLGSLWVF